tara:strand:- start:8298 stop:9089 length:792 start_codon:yes stop_codon:yes gene_type:complete
MKINLNLKETGTSPVVIHGNGKSSRGLTVYHKIIEKFLTNESPTETTDTKDITIVSWKGGKYKNTETMLETFMRFYDFPIVMLDWPENTNFWEGSKSKVTKTLEAINNGLINTKYVMWFDAGDVGLLRHPHELLEKYKEYYSDYDLVFNAEKNNYPTPERMAPVSDDLNSRFEEIKKLDEEKTHGSSYKYLNSGCLIGKTETLKTFLEHASTIGLDEPINDTVMCRIAQYDMEDKVCVDNLCKLFVCLYNVSDDEIEIGVSDE